MQERDLLKQKAAIAALSYLPENAIIGVGTGSTVEFFIDELAKFKHKIKGAVASSERTLAKLKALNIEIYELFEVGHVPMYIDGADEANSYGHLIKGGGGALTREKILAASADKFICIIDEGKLVQRLGDFPLPVEVIPMARSLAGRELVKLGGDPKYRSGFVTDNGNIIIDVANLKILDPIKMEEQIDNIPGVVSNGIFAKRPADLLLVGTPEGVMTLGNL